MTSILHISYFVKVFTKWGCGQKYPKKWPHGLWMTPSSESGKTIQENLTNIMGRCMHPNYAHRAAMLLWRYSWHLRALYSPQFTSFFFLKCTFRNRYFPSSIFVISVLDNKVILKIGENPKFNKCKQ